MIRYIKYAILIVSSLYFTQCSKQQIDFSNFDKIDSHLHVRYSGYELLDQAVADHFKVVAIVHDRYDIDWQTAFVEKQRGKYPDQVDFLTTFTMQGWDEFDWQEKTIDRLKKAFQDGAIGVKVWKNIGMEFRDKEGRFVMIDHPHFDPILDFIASQNKTLTGHLVEPLDGWLPLEQMKAPSNREYFIKNPQYHMFGRPDYPSHSQLVQAYERMLAKHPHIRYVGCHLAGFEWNLDELALRLDRFPNMAVDVSGRMSDLQFLERDKVRLFFIRYQDRILYGTDLSINEKHDPRQYAGTAHRTWKNDWVYLATDSLLTIPGSEKSVQGLNLPSSVLKNIYWNNAKKWYSGM